MDVNKIKDEIVGKLSGLGQIRGIAQTGKLDADLVPGQSDIDIFVLCSRIPSIKERKFLYKEFACVYSSCEMEVCDGGMWGHGDILAIKGIDVMFMYFTVDEMEKYIDEVLCGRHLDSEEGFYPTGRLSSVEHINILYEEEQVWNQLKIKAGEHSEVLFGKLFVHHTACILDQEDLGRVLLRKEILFYHQVLENAIDHFLQALFALNRVYFPSRKRSEEYIRSFQKKPYRCYERLISIVQGAADRSGIEASVGELKKLTEELKALVK